MVCGVGGIGVAVDTGVARAAAKVIAYKPHPVLRDQRPNQPDQETDNNTTCTFHSELINRPMITADHAPFVS